MGLSYYKVGVPEEDEDELDRWIEAFIEWIGYQGDVVNCIVDLKMTRIVQCPLQLAKLKALRQFDTVEEPSFRPIRPATEILIVRVA